MCSVLSCFQGFHLDHFFLSWKYIFFSVSVCNKKHPPGQVFNRNICQEMDIQSFQCTLLYFRLLGTIFNIGNYFVLVL